MFNLAEIFREVGGRYPHPGFIKKLKVAHLVFPQSHIFMVGIVLKLKFSFGSLPKIRVFNLAEIFREVGGRYPHPGFIEKLKVAHLVFPQSHIFMVTVVLKNQFWFIAKNPRVQFGRNF